MIIKLGYWIIRNVYKLSGKKLIVVNYDAPYKLGEIIVSSDPLTDLVYLGNKTFIYKIDI